MKGSYSKALLIACVALALGGCGGDVATNSNTTNANAPTVQKVDPKDLPPGLSASPLAPSANSTPGIPAPGNADVPKGATPTPGIPDPKTIGKPLKPGATPTPGIPDAETIRRQMQQRNGINGNPVPPPPANTQPRGSRKAIKPVNGQ